MIYKANVNTEGGTDSNTRAVEDLNIPLIPTAHHPDRNQEGNIGQALNDTLDQVFLTDI